MYSGDTKALHRAGAPAAGGVRLPQRQRQPRHQHRPEAHRRAAPLPGEEPAQDVRQRARQVLSHSVWQTVK